MKIKACIFDLDGTLISTKDLHFSTLNKALESIDSKYVISKDEHISLYNGLSTNKKLELLTKEKDFPPNLYGQVWKLKQDFTVSELRDTIKRDEEKCLIFHCLKKFGYKTMVASNSIYETVKICLYKTGIIEYLDGFMCNEEVRFQKPHPEMYLRCFVKLGIAPKEALIFEDNEYGKEAARLSGGNLIEVQDPSDITLLSVQTNLNYYNT